MSWGIEKGIKFLKTPFWSFVFCLCLASYLDFFSLVVSYLLRWDYADYFEDIFLKYQGLSITIIKLMQKGVLYFSLREIIEDLIFPFSLIVLSSLILYFREKVSLIFAEGRIRNNFLKFSSFMLQDFTWLPLGVSVASLLLVHNCLQRVHREYVYAVNRVIFKELRQVGVGRERGVPQKKISSTKKTAIRSIEPACYFFPKEKSNLKVYNISYRDFVLHFFGYYPASPMQMIDQVRGISNKANIYVTEKACKAALFPTDKEVFKREEILNLLDKANRGICQQMTKIKSHGQSFLIIDHVNDKNLIYLTNNGMSRKSVLLAEVEYICTDNYDEWVTFTFSGIP